MIDKLNDVYKNVKSRLDYKIFMNIYEGIFLMIFSIIALIFDSKIGTISVLYLLPISLILESFLYLYVGCKYTIEKINLIAMLIGSVVLLAIPIYVALNPITSSQNFISTIGIVIIVKNIIDFLSTFDKQKVELIKNILVIILGLLVIVFSSYISSSYIILLIVGIIVGLLKILFAMSLKKVIKK